MKKMLIPCLALVIISILAHVASAQTIVAHRGLFLKPGSEVAENSVAAIVRAYTYGYTAVELDVRTTSDGVAVLMHDNAVDPVSGTDANFAGFSPQRTTNWDGMSGKYTAAANGGFSLIGYPAPSGTPLNPSQANMQNNFSYLKVYNQSGTIINQQTGIPAGVQYPWRLQDVFEYLNNHSKYQSITIVLDIQSYEALQAAKSVVASVSPLNPIVFKVWTTALYLLNGVPVADLSSVPTQYRNLVVSDNMIERPNNSTTTVYLKDKTQTALYSQINTTNLHNLKGIEYFVKGDSSDATILNDIQNAPSSLQKWGVLRLYDYSTAQGASRTYNGQTWQCAGQYLIGSTGLCYFTANTGKVTVSPYSKIQAAQNLLSNYSFDNVVMDVYAAN